MLKVLVLDDSRSVRQQVRDILEPQGFSIVEGGDGTEGLALLAQHKDVGLIVCDLNMPRINGLAFVDFVRSRPDYAAIPVLLLTGEAKPELIERARRAGAKGYLIKPFTSDTLLSAVRKISSGRSSTMPPGSAPASRAGFRPTGVPPAAPAPKIPPGTSPPPGNVPPGTVPPAMPPGTMPPGTMPPGTMPPGTMPPGTMPPGTKAGTPGPTPPSLTPPSPVSPSKAPEGPATTPPPTSPSPGTGGGTGAEPKAPSAAHVNGVAPRRS